MRNVRIGLYAVMIFMLALGCASDRDWSEADTAEITSQLIERAEADQQIRQADPATMSAEERRELAARWREVDHGNTAWLKRVVERHGWPTAERVGQEAAQGAFLIVQHADHDVEFQAECLPMLERAAERGEIPRWQFAYLTDRVRVKQKRPQLYGTQYDVRRAPDGSALADADGQVEYVLPVVEDVASLDERRLAAGLSPWFEYEKKMASMHGREPQVAPIEWDGELPVRR